MSARPNAPAGPWRVRVDADQETSAILERAPTAASAPLFICAHGAGGHMNDRGMLAVSDLLRNRGLDVVRFNFLYRERRSSSPDPMQRLQQCYRAVAEQVRAGAEDSCLILGGRSMGGRVASMLAADSYPCAGLLLFAYPLHPAGQPGRLRDAHLERIPVPVLCFNGTRDALCRRDLMERAIVPLADRWTMHWLDGADHGWHVLKSSGRTDQDVLTEVGQACADWIGQLACSSPIRTG